MLSPERRAEIKKMVDDWQYEIGSPGLCNQVTQVVEELLDEDAKDTHKLDALVAAVFAQDDETKDRILALAKQYEAEYPADGDDDTGE